MMYLLPSRFLSNWIFSATLFSVVLFCADISAQKLTPQEEYSKILEKFPDRSVVCVQREERSRIEYFEGNLRVISDHRRENIFLDDKGNFYNEVQVPSSDFFKAEKIDVRSLVPSGKKYKEIKTKVIEQQDNLEGMVFHDDLVLYSATFPDCHKGSKSLLRYREVIPEPHFFGMYYFDTPGMPTIDSYYEVSVPAGIDLAHVYFNLDSSNVIYTIQPQKDGRMLHSWRMTDLKETKMDPQNRGFKHLAPHVMVFIRSISTVNSKVNYLSDYNDLHRWYYHFISGVNKESTPALDSMALAITQGSPTDMDKIRRVFYWVQDNIKYIAFESGLGGFIPRQAKDIYEKRFGDCKDMTSIMHQMLKTAGVTTHFTWIGTRELPYSYHVVPTPFNDNHMILSYKNGNEWVFIDGTSSFNELGFPSSFIQGKEAMVNIDASKCEIVKVPEVSSDVNHIADTLRLELRDGKLVGRGRIRFNGYYKQSINRAIVSMTKEENFSYFKGMLEKGSNKFMLDSIRVNNKGDRDLPLFVDYQFNLKDYAYQNEDELYVNMHLGKQYQNDYIDAKRTSDLERNFAFSHNWHYELIVPEGYKMVRVPDNVDYSSEQFSFKILYKTIGNKIELDFTYVNNFIVLNKQFFADWNSFITKLNNAFKQSIILKKNK